MEQHSQQMSHNIKLDLSNQKPFEVNGYSLFLDDKDSLDLRKDKIYDGDETRFIESIVRPDWTCLDIGANIGYFTILMSRNCERVFAFEPDPYNYELLYVNKNWNDAKNVSIFNYAVTGYVGKVKLHECKFNRGMHRIYPSKWCEGKVTEVDTIPLDNLKELESIQKINFVKLDIEGAELGALRGMKKLLKKHTPILLIEFHPPTIQEYGHDPKDTYDFLKELGYSISLLATSFIPTSQTINNISYNELLSLTFNSPGRNILCV